MRKESTENNINNLIILDDKLIELNQQNQITNIVYNNDFSTFNLRNIYLGKVERIVKELEIAYINIGAEKLGFLPKHNLITPEKNLAVGEHILVQILREQIDDKGVLLTQKISLESDYLIYFPLENLARNKVNISKKIVDNKAKKFLKNLVENITKNNNYGNFIIRSKAENLITNKHINDLLTNDVNNLTLLWEQQIKTNLYKKSVPSLLYNCYQNKIQNYIKTFANVYADKVVINNIFPSLKSQLDNLKNNVVYLANGANIIIEKTTALTVIDVNSGNIENNKIYQGKFTFSESILQINKAAAVEIIRQIKLRNIGGIIVVDFIKMHTENHQKIIVELLKNESINDNHKCKILGFTNAGLCEIIRQKTQNEIKF